jgi:hypothetical protein
MQGPTMPCWPEAHAAQQRPGDAVVPCEAATPSQWSIELIPHS